MQAFGAKLNNSEGEVRTERIDKIWERSTLLQGKVYRVPGGSVGRQFTSMLAKV